MSIRYSIYLFVLSINLSFGSNLPWISKIDPDHSVDTINKVKTIYKVSVSDGKTYSATSFYNGDQRVIFRADYPDKVIIRGVEDKYFWEYDGESEKDGSEFVRDFVKGHQFFAQIFMFDHLHSEISDPEETEFKGKKCLKVYTINEEWEYSMYYEEGQKPLGMELNIKDLPVIRFEFSDWQFVENILIPHFIKIDDQSRVFDYSLTSILFNQGEIDEFRTPEHQLNDEQKLIRQHRLIMDGHLFEKQDFLYPILDDMFTIVNEGEINSTSRKDTNEQMNNMLSGREYLQYTDLVRPKVTVSDDGTLGWVIVQVKARGVKFGPKKNIPFEFVSGWVELYKKKDGIWKMTGNVSNFR